MGKSRFAGRKKPPLIPRALFRGSHVLVWCTLQRLPATLPSHRYQTFASTRNIAEPGCNNWPPLSNQNATVAFYTWLSRGFLYVAERWEEDELVGF